MHVSPVFGDRSMIKDSLRHHISDKLDVVRPKMSRKQKQKHYSLTKHVKFCNHEVYLR